MPAPEAMSTNPVGEDNWVAYAEEAIRHANTLEQRVQVVELFKNATVAEPESVKVWVAYCDYFWSLYHSCQNGELPGWTREEQLIGRELFSIDSALSLWNQAYDAVKYRLGDSNQLWDRWISLELDQLSRTRTQDGVKRITHLFRNRLTVPHATWDNTSSMFSSFLSEYNKPAWEQIMAEVTTAGQEAKKLYEPRDRYEMRLNKAVKDGDLNAHRAALKEYLGWEIIQSRRDHEHRWISLEICKGLFGRALSGIFSTDEGMWNDYLVFLSTMQTESPSAQDKLVSEAQLDAAKRSVQHCSWSGPLWARYMLTAEEAGLPFADMEAIKHEATSSQLGRDGMTGIIDMYSAWCGYLKRTATDPYATEQSIDLAEMGLPAALEDVQLWGKRLYKDAYKGDPNFRLERIYIQYLTEGGRGVEDARNIWIGLASKDLYADSYNFWVHYYLWEMLVFSGHTKDVISQASNKVKVAKFPTLATNVLARAVNRKTLDWPERVMEVYLQHCNDYESPTTLRQATDLVHRVQKTVSKRREREQAEAAHAWQAHQARAHSLSSQPASHSPQASTSPSGSKRKREISPEGEDSSSKRAKNDEGPSSTESEQAPKRDRENTSVLVTNLPADATQTKIRQYFREYGHINNLTVKQEADGSSSAALIEFRTIEEAQSALLRDAKYFGQAQISVVPAAGLILFVTNFPPKADDSYIRNLFKDCGAIFSIRWPSLKFNTHRRFVYVSFRDAAATAKAVKLDGSVLEGKYKLEVKYSDPARKKAREGAVAEGRECHVANLDKECSESDVRQLFSKYGSVSSVRILRNMAGRSRGTAFVVFTTKDEAEAAVQALDKTKFGKEILRVEISQQTNFKPVAKTARTRSGSPASLHSDADGGAAMTDGEPTPADIQNRTVAIMGLTDTVNDARVRALVEPHGKLVKLVLRPDHGGAILEFADAAMAGTATLALEGVDVDGRKIRTGTVKDLFKEKGVHEGDKIDIGKSKEKAAAMAPPSMVARRPVLGGRGGKRGLGFSVPKPTVSADSVTKSNPPAKSNADFRAMVLNRKQDGKGKNETETTETD